MPGTEEDSAIHVEVNPNADPYKDPVGKKWVAEHAAELESAIGEAVKSLGWKGTVWVTVNKK